MKPLPFDFPPIIPMRWEMAILPNFNMRIAISIFASIVLIGCNPSGETADPSGSKADQPDVRHVAETFRNLKSMTKQPVYVNPALAMLCRGASLADVEAARKASGPHANTAVSIFMNDLAAGAFGKTNAAYPIGSIIVKEKKAMGYWSTTQPRQMIKANDGVGGMIKRPAGYDPQHGDWEYFYFEDPAKIESGKISSCVQCHSGAASKDYVFGGWAGGR